MDDDIDMFKANDILYNYSKRQLASVLKIASHIYSSDQDYIIITTSISSESFY